MMSHWLLFLIVNISILVLILILCLTVLILLMVWYLSQLRLVKRELHRHMLATKQILKTKADVCHCVLAGYSSPLDYSLYGCYCAKAQAELNAQRMNKADDTYTDPITD